LSLSTYGDKIFSVVWTLLLTDQQMNIVELAVSIKILFREA